MLKSTKQSLLLTHKFDCDDPIFPPLSREEFTQVFIDGFSKYPLISCTLVNHYYWITKITFPFPKFSPEDIAKITAQALAQKRLAENPIGHIIPDIIILGEKSSHSGLYHDDFTRQNSHYTLTIIETKTGEALLKNFKSKSSYSSVDNQEFFTVTLIHN
jgi:hypothetical protein